MEPILLSNYVMDVVMVCDVNVWWTVMSRVTCGAKYFSQRSEILMSVIVVSRGTFLVIRGVTIFGIRARLRVELSNHCRWRKF